MIATIRAKSRKKTKNRTSTQIATNSETITNDRSSPVIGNKNHARPIYKMEQRIKNKTKPAAHSLLSTSVCSVGCI